MVLYYSVITLDVLMVKKCSIECMHVNQKKITAEQ